MSKGFIAETDVLTEDEQRDVEEILTGLERDFIRRSQNMTIMLWYWGSFAPYNLVLTAILNSVKHLYIPRKMTFHFFYGDFITNELLRETLLALHNELANHVRQLTFYVENSGDRMIDFTRFGFPQPTQILQIERNFSYSWKA